MRAAPRARACAALLAVIALSPSSTRAQTNAVAVAAGTSAGIAASQATRPMQLAPDPEIGRDLAAFADPVSRRTSRLQTGCDGATTELSVSTTALFNYLNIAVANQSERDLTITHDGIRARFAHGRVRRLEWMLPRDVTVRSGFWAQFAARFPDKADFADQSSFDIDVVLEDVNGERCTITTHFARDPARELDARASTRYWAMEIELAAGIRLLATSGLDELGANYAPLLDIGFAWYPALHHGLRLELGGGTYGSDGAERVEPDATFEGTPRVVPFELLLSYSARLFLTPWLAATYNLGGGLYTLELVDDSSASFPSETLLVPRHQVRLAATLANIDYGTDFGLGLSVTHMWALAGRMGPVETRGHSLGVMLHVIAGGAM